MDKTTRWETAAIRTGSRARNQPPRPSGKRPGATVRWVTLKEAEAATSIPVNTLRKWTRKSDLPSYLESDGDIALRMVDLDAVIDRARRLGRTVPPSGGTSESSSEGGPRAREPGGAGDRATSESSSEGGPRAREPGRAGDRATSESSSEGGPRAREPGGAGDRATSESPPAETTMIVPIDAWNKMLSQLGNLHEAGQQLAEARERAAKAETEAMFLRQRLAELRSDAERTDEGDATSRAGSADGDGERSELPAPETPPETTTYWRYVTKGWRDRRRRHSNGV